MAAKKISNEIGMAFSAAEESCAAEAGTQVLQTAPLEAELSKQPCLSDLYFQKKLTELLGGAKAQIRKNTVNDHDLDSQLSFDQQLQDPIDDLETLRNLAVELLQDTFIELKKEGLLENQEGLIATQD